MDARIFDELNGTPPNTLDAIVADIASRTGERYVGEILNLAFRLQQENAYDSFDACVADAKRLWFSLLTDPDVVAGAAQPARAAAIARLLLQRPGGDLS